MVGSHEASWVEATNKCELTALLFSPHLKILLLCFSGVDVNLPSLIGKS